MSTVAWDGKSLAADRMGAMGYLKVTAPKLELLPGRLVVATTGDYAAGRIMIKWFQDGSDLTRYPACQADDDNNATLIVATPEGCYFYGMHPHPTPVNDPCMAWGSGRDFALGAMAMGANAKEAILIASRFDAYTGKGVDTETP